MIELLQIQAWGYSKIEIIKGGFVSHEFHTFLDN